MIQYSSAVLEIEDASRLRANLAICFQRNHPIGAALTFGVSS